VPHTASHAVKIRWEENVQKKRFTDNGSTETDPTRLLDGYEWA